MQSFSSTITTRILVSIVKFSMLTYLGFELNSAKDQGLHDLTIREVKESLENGALFELLERRSGIGLDLSLLNMKDRKELGERFLDMAHAVNERKKFGVEKSGLNLLLAYVLEQIQREAGQVPIVRLK